MIDSERCLAEAIVEVLADLGTTVPLDDFAHLFGSTEADEQWEELFMRWGQRVSVPPVTDPRIDKILTAARTSCPYFRASENSSTAPAQQGGDWRSLRVADGRGSTRSSSDSAWRPPSTSS
jgi:hypothetical protein